MNCCLRQDHKHLGCLLHGLSDGHCGCCCSNWRSLTRIEPLPVCRSISSLAARETRVQTQLAGVAEADLECKMSMKNRDFDQTLLWPPQEKLALNAG